MYKVNVEVPLLCCVEIFEDSSYYMNVNTMWEV